MSDTYKMLAEFAQTWGLLYFFVIFLVVLVYALWHRQDLVFTLGQAAGLRRPARPPLDGVSYSSSAQSR